MTRQVEYNARHDDTIGDEKPKAEGELENGNPLDGSIHITSPSAGKFQERIKELEKKAEHVKKTHGESLLTLDSFINGLKEGYSLGKQDMIKEIEKKFARQGDEYQNVLVVNERDWGIIKKRGGIE